jgi:hypothetical protein
VNENLVTKNMKKDPEGDIRKETIDLFKKGLIDHN